MHFERAGLCSVKRIHGRWHCLGKAIDIIRKKNPRDTERERELADTRAEAKASSKPRTPGPGGQGRAQATAEGEDADPCLRSTAVQGEPGRRPPALCARRGQRRHGSLEPRAKCGHGGRMDIAAVRRVL